MSRPARNAIRSGDCPAAQSFRYWSTGVGRRRRSCIAGLQPESPGHALLGPGELHPKLVRGSAQRNREFFPRLSGGPALGNSTLIGGEHLPTTEQEFLPLHLADRVFVAGDLMGLVAQTDRTAGIALSAYSLCAASSDLLHAIFTRSRAGSSGRSMSNCPAAARRKKLFKTD